MLDLKVGDNVKIINNEIFGFMGLSIATGTILFLRDGGFSIQCRETRAVESVDFGDGKIIKL